MSNRPLTPPHVTRRRFLRMMGALGAAGGAATLAGVYGFNIEPHQLEIERVNIALSRLPGAFDGMTIAQLSDLHYGPYVSYEFLERAVQATNALAPDVIAVTGDFVNSSWKYIQPCAELLGQLQAPYGVFAVMGNHDYWVGELDLVLRSLRAHRVRLLRNQAAPLTRGRSTMYLVGLDDWWQNLADLRRALASVPHNACKVVLMHEPDYADLCAQAEVDLQLSGHSHGGQVRLPFWGPLTLPRFGVKYPMGLARAGNFTQVYTTRGVGVLPPPVRFNCPPEITLLTLTTM